VRESEGWYVRGVDGDWNPSRRGRDREAFDKLVETCGRYMHDVTSWEDPRTLAHHFQHGENPESQLVIPANEILDSPDKTFAPRVWAWVERLHEYELRVGGAALEGDENA
jgi:hypothetical protein